MKSGGHSYKSMTLVYVSLACATQPVVSIINHAMIGCRPSGAAAVRTACISPHRRCSGSLVACSLLQQGGQGKQEHGHLQWLAEPELMTQQRCCDDTPPQEVILLTKSFQSLEIGHTVKPLAPLFFSSPLVVRNRRPGGAN